MAESTTNYTNWDFYNQRVERDTTAGQFISAETTLIASGPADLTNTSGARGIEGDSTKSATDVICYPIGLLESFGLQQNRQLQRIFEIGSSRSYFIPGRNVGSISLGRTMYYGPSLLRVLYAGHSTTGVVTSSIGGGTKTEIAHVLRRRPGFSEDNFYIDLASDLFAQPTGLAVYFKDYDEHTAAAFYLQNCYVQGHQFNVSSGSVLIMEGAQLQYDTLVPIQMQAAKTT